MPTAIHTTATLKYIGSVPTPSGHPHEMASSKSGEVAIKVGSSPKGKWIFSKEEMQNMATIREGIDEFKELQFRQQSTKFIQLLGDRLNQNLKDNRFKITQLCMCAAMIHMHRFFYFHSFTFFDYRDVAAACLFLSGKSEECPRKIDHIVHAWWSEKFPGIPLDKQRYMDAMSLLVAIESIILQTIAFDLQVALPHPLVLKAMHTIAKNNRKITEVVYFFSTDVLCVTSWGIRYTAEAIAVACVHIVCTWANFEMPSEVNGAKWYHKTDPTMTEEQLQEMMLEFISVYRTCRNDLAITKFIKKGEIRDPIPDAERNSADRATPPALQDDAGELCLPPPPPPPANLVAKKVDIQAYKERRAAAADASVSKEHGGGSQSEKRRNFMPEMSQTKGMPATISGFVPPSGMERKQEPSSRDDHRNAQRQPSNGGPMNASSHQQSSRSSGHYQQQHHQQQQYMQQQQPSSSSADRQQSMVGDRERGEKRKREQSSGGLSVDKRARQDASGMGGQQQQRGHHNALPSSSSSMSGGSSSGSYNSVPPPQPQPLMQHGSSSSSHYKQHQSSHGVSNGHHHHSSSTQQQMHMQQQHRQYHPYAAAANAAVQQQSHGYSVPPPQLSYSGASSHHHQQQQQPGYHMQNGFGMGSVPPPPPPPAMPATGNDLEDGEVY